MNTDRLSPRLLILLNLIVYQGSWFLCVLGGNSLAWIAPLLVIAFLLISPYRKADLIMIGGLVVTGIIVDGLLKMAGLFSFAEDGTPIPFWLAMIWVALGILPNHSLRWLHKRLPLAALCGAVSGPMAYISGAKLGAATLNWSFATAIIVLAVIWALLTPLILLGSRKLSG